MLNNTTRVYHQAEVDAIRKAIDKTGRSIVLSLSPGPDDPSWLPNSSSHLNANANLWRVVNDFWDFNALTDLPGVFRAANTWQGVSGLSPGHWADLDMLPLGYLGPRNEWHTSGQTTFTRNEQVTIMSLWSILPSPLMYGGNPARLSSDAWTLALLANEEVMAVNQDVLGARGKRMASGGNEIWVRDLSGGRKAVAFFNRGTQDATMSATFAQIGVTGTPIVRDLWRRADVTGVTTGLSASVPGGAALLYTLSPAGTGAGGAGGATGGTGGAGGRGGAAGGAGAGGASGVAGAGNAGRGGAAAGSSGGAGSGGTSGAAGASGRGGAVGSAGVGGVAGATAGVAGSGNGGVTGTAGIAGGAGASGRGGVAGAVAGTQGSAGAGTAGSGGTPDGGSGCGCDVVPTHTTPLSVGLCLAVLATLLRRRPRPRHGEADPLIRND